MTRVRVDRRGYLSALCRTVPYTITEKVLASPEPSSLAPETFDGTFLFLDVVGFTAWCERTVAGGPDGLGTLSGKLSDFFTRLLEEALFPHEGYVIQFGGDSLSVVFRGEDHALRALAGALTARVIVREAAAETADALHVRVGITSGEVNLLVLGDASQRAQVVAGRVAAHAVRLQGRAEPDEIMCSPEVRDLVGGDAVFSEVADGVLRVDDLLRVPVRSRVVELGDRVDGQIEEKIALLEPFVPAPLRERLKSVPQGWRLDGEVRRAIVVFMEMTGWSGMQADLAQHMGLSLLRAFRRYGGVVAKVDIMTTGHRIMVVFGLHGPTDNDAERAILASIDATASIKTLSQVAQEPVTAKVGIHVGPVFFGAIGSDYRHDITCIGDAVNVAARAGSEGNDYEVIVTEELLKDARAEFSSEPRPPIAVKGKKAPLKLHLVRGTADVRSHYVQRRLGTRYLAGREQQLTRMRSLVDRAMHGEGRIISLCGGPGSGKSVLLSQLVNRWLDGGGIGLLARCRYATQGEPLGPVRGMFQSFLGLGAGDLSQQRDRVRERLKGFDLGGGEEVLIDLLTSKDLVDAGVNPFSDEGSRWEAALDAIMRFVAIRVDQEPVLYVLEDIHNADGLTLELCRRFAAFRKERSFLFVATYRDEESVASLRAAIDEEILLPDLSLKDTTELVRHQLGADKVDDDVAAFLWRRTHGNPGGLIELLRFLRDRSLLHVHNGRVRAADPGVELLVDVVPGSLAQLALGRLDHLGVIERRLLRIGSAIGSLFPRGVLTEVARTDELDDGFIDAALEKLVDEGVVASEGRKHPAYRFREDVTRAVTYGTIPEEERREVHARIADALERSDDNVNPITLAMHRERAGQLGRALKWYEAAIRATSRAGLDQETRHLVDRWTTLAAQVDGEDAPSLRRRGRMAVKKLIAVARRGAPKETLEVGRKILAEHWAALDEDARVVVDLWLGAALLALEQDGPAEMRLTRAFEKARDGAARCEAARLLARQRRALLDAEGANDWLTRAAELTGGSFRRDARVELERTLLRLDAGEIDEARARLVDLLRRVRRHDDMRLAAMASAHLAVCEMLTGELDAATTAIEETRVIGRALGNRGLEATAESRLGRVALWRREPNQARPRLERALATARDLGMRALEIETEIGYGLAVALTDDVDGGRELLEIAVARAGERMPYAAVEGRLHLARVELLREDRDAARAHLDVASRAPESRAPLFADAIDELRARAG
jgi:class 3 adenylate cyclase